MTVREFRKRPHEKRLETIRAEVLVEKKPTDKRLFQDRGKNASEVLEVSQSPLCIVRTKPAWQSRYAVTALTKLSSRVGCSMMCSLAGLRACGRELFAESTRRCN
jgi:hypothetical protein